jgi:hypothetical protein
MRVHHLRERVDDQQAIAFTELPHALIYANDEADVDVYRAELDKFRQSAIFGDKASAFIRSLR